MTGPEIVDESIDDDLCRENPDERHVVSGGAGLAIPKLAHEELHRPWIEDAVPPYLSVGQQVVDVAATAPPEKGFALGRTVWLLRSAPHRRREALRSIA